MGALFVALSLWGTPQQQDDLQGTWQGTGADARYSATFCDDVLAVLIWTDPGIALREFRFSVDRDEGTIDVQRDGGVQLGRYLIEGDTLTIVLANVNWPRPEVSDLTAAGPAIAPAFGDRKGRRRWMQPQQRHVFQRARDRSSE